jgi:flagellar assembly protein FliH
VLEAQLAAVEREAFARGFAEGEAAGAAAASGEGEAILRQLTQALQDVSALRTDMIRRSERQIVELALTLAKRVIHREISQDQNLLLSMVRGALTRLDDSARITVRLNPHDYEASGGAQISQLGTNVIVVADAKVERGGCRVESDLGTLDAGVDAQIQEFGRTLLGDHPEPSELSNVA